MKWSTASSTTSVNGRQVHKGCERPKPADPHGHDRPRPGGQHARQRWSLRRDPRSNSAGFYLVDARDSTGDRDRVAASRRRAGGASRSARSWGDAGVRYWCSTAIRWSRRSDGRRFSVSGRARTRSGRSGSERRLSRCVLPRRVRRVLAAVIRAVGDSTSPRRRCRTPSRPRSKRCRRRLAGEPARLARPAARKRSIDVLRRSGRLGEDPGPSSVTSRRRHNTCRRRWISAVPDERLR